MHVKAITRYHPVPVSCDVGPIGSRPATLYRYD